MATESAATINAGRCVANGGLRDETPYLSLSVRRIDRLATTIALGPRHPPITLPRGPIGGRSLPRSKCVPCVECIPPFLLAGRAGVGNVGSQCQEAGPGNLPASLLSVGVVQSLAPNRRCSSARSRQHAVRTGIAYPTRICAALETRAEFRRSRGGLRRQITNYVSTIRASAWSRPRGHECGGSCPLAGGFSSNNPCGPHACPAFCDRSAQAKARGRPPNNPPTDRNSPTHRALENARQEGTGFDGRPLIGIRSSVARSAKRTHRRRPQARLVKRR